MNEPSLNYVNCPDVTGGHRMGYWQWGQPDSAHVVLCVHGLSRQGRDFDVLAQTLCAQGMQRPGGIRVICPDVAGRGASDWLKDPMGYQVAAYAADMLVLLDELYKQSPISTLDWVGTSMGGLIGMVVCGQPALRGAAQSAASSAAGGTASGAASLGVKPALAVPVHRLVLNDVGPALQWRAIERISAYLGEAGHFSSVQAAADAMWAISRGFGPHTPEQWLALSRPMVRPVSTAAGSLWRLHYDPAISAPFKAATEASTQQGEALLWQLYDNIEAETLLLRGAQSDLLSVETAHAMTERGPRARLVEFEGVGHVPTLIAQDQLDVVVGFLLA